MGFWRDRTPNLTQSRLGGTRSWYIGILADRNAGPRSLTNRIDGFYDRRLQRSNLGKPVKKSIDSDRRTSRTSRGMDVDEIEK